MPITPYHFGPSAFIGLVLKKWIDLPVFVLANVVVDLEVLVNNFLKLGWPVHRYVHTLLIGTIAGAVWGLAAYPLKDIFKWAMNLAQLTYQPNMLKMIISGILGIWLHNIIDSVYHTDVRLFWPNESKPLWNLVSHNQLKYICIAFWIAAIAVYVVNLIISLKSK